MAAPPAPSRISLGGLAYALQLTASPTSMTSLNDVGVNFGAFNIESYNGVPIQILGLSISSKGMQETYELEFAENAGFVSIKNNSLLFNWYVDGGSIINNPTPTSVIVEVAGGAGPMYVNCNYTNALKSINEIISIEVSLS